MHCPQVYGIPCFQAAQCIVQNEQSVHDQNGCCAQGGAITCIDFSPVYPYNYAVTALTNVLIYDARTRKQIKTWSPLKEKTYSGTFRNDGRLLVVGGESGRVQVSLCTATQQDFCSSDENMRRCLHLRCFWKNCCWIHGRSGMLLHVQDCGAGV